MRIRGIFHRSVTCARTDDTLRRAAYLMRSGGFGALPVYDCDRLAGIFTERDLVDAVAAESDPERATAAHWRTADALVADPEEDSFEVAQCMLAAGIGHFPSSRRVD